jgi:hypothetical protein
VEDLRGSDPDQAKTECVEQVALQHQVPGVREADSRKREVFSSNPSFTDASVEGVGTTLDDNVDAHAKSSQKTNIPAYPLPDPSTRSGNRMYDV